MMKYVKPTLEMIDLNEDVITTSTDCSGIDLPLDCLGADKEG